MSTIFWLIAFSLIHPFASVCLGHACALDRPAIVEATACCEAPPAEPVDCHHVPGKSNHDPCVSCLITPLPGVRDSTPTDLPPLDIALFEPVLWTVPAAPLPISECPVPLGTPPPTLVNLHTMLTC